MDSDDDYQVYQHLFGEVAGCSENDSSGFLDETMEAAGTTHGEACDVDNEALPKPFLEGDSVHMQTKDIVGYFNKALSNRQMISPSYPQSEVAPACYLVFEQTGNYNDVQCDQLGVWTATEGASRHSLHVTDSFVHLLKSENIEKAFKQVYPSLNFLLCELHFRENIRHACKKTGIEGHTVDVCEIIFGRRQGNQKQAGLMDCRAENEFDQSLANMVETVNQYGPAGKKFMEYFLKFKLPLIKGKMNVQLRAAAGLGPKSFFFNDVECIQGVYKQNLTENASLPEALAHLRNFVEQQQSNAEQAQLDSSCYTLAPGYRHLKVSANFSGYAESKRREILGRIHAISATSSCLATVEESINTNNTQNSAQDVGLGLEITSTQVFASDAILCSKVTVEFPQPERNPIDFNSVSAETGLLDISIDEALARVSPKNRGKKLNATQRRKSQIKYPELKKVLYDPETHEGEPPARKKNRTSYSDSAKDDEVKESSFVELPPQNRLQRRVLKVSPKEGSYELHLLMSCNKNTKICYGCSVAEPRVSIFDQRFKTDDDRIKSRNELVVVARINRKHFDSAAGEYRTDKKLSLAYFHCRKICLLNGGFRPSLENTVLLDSVRLSLTKEQYGQWKRLQQEMLE